jgi:hypothetical protein
VPTLDPVAGTLPAWVTGTTKSGSVAGTTKSGGGPVVVQPAPVDTTHVTYVPPPADKPSKQLSLL